MPAVAPPTFPAVSIPPTTDDPVNFDPRMDTWLMEQTTIIRPTMIALGANVYGNAVYAEDRANAASTSAGTAGTHAGSALTYRNEASVFAATAVNAPGTQGTSTTTMSIGTGAKTLTTQAGKALGAGQSIIAARSADPVNNRVYGVVSSYNSTTGVLNFTVPNGGTWGSGTYTDWTINVTGPRSDIASNITAVTGTTVTAIAGGQYSLQSASATTLTLPASPNHGDTVVIHCSNARVDNVVARNSQTLIGLAEDMTMDAPVVAVALVFITGYGWRFA